MFVMPAGVISGRTAPVWCGRRGFITGRHPVVATVHDATLSTHDTKRGEDVRDIGVLSAVAVGRDSSATWHARPVP